MPATTWPYDNGRTGHDGAIAIRACLLSLTDHLLIMPQPYPAMITCYISFWRELCGQALDALNAMGDSNGRALTAEEMDGLVRRLNAALDRDQGSGIGGQG